MKTLTQVVLIGLLTVGCSNYKHQLGMYRRSSHDNGMTTLHQAVTKGDREKIAELLTQGADINARDNEGKTALHLAAQEGDREIAFLLLSKKEDIDPDARTKDHETALHVSTSHRDRELALLLLKNKADVDARDKELTTPLHIAASNGDQAISSLLLKYQADYDVQDSELESPLYKACENNHLAVVKLLLQQGAYTARPQVQKIARENKRGYRYTGDVNKIPLLHIALKNENMEMGKLLLSYQALDGINELLPVKISRISRKGNICYDDVKTTPLHIAIAKGDHELVKLLLEAKADPNGVNEHGQTPLHTAVIHKNYEAVVVLLNNQASVAVKDNGGKTALTICVEESNKGHSSSWGYDDEKSTQKDALVKIVSLLLEHGADPNDCDENYHHLQSAYHTTPLHLAAAAGNDALALLMLNHGGDINALDRDGNTPLHIAVLNKKYTFLQKVCQTFMDQKRGAIIAECAVTLVGASASTVLNDLSNIVMDYVTWPDFTIRNKAGYTPPEVLLENNSDPQQVTQLIDTMTRLKI